MLSGCCAYQCLVDRTTGDAQQRKLSNKVCRV